MLVKHSKTHSMINGTLRVNMQAGRTMPEQTIMSFDSMTMFEGRAALQRYVIDEALRTAPHAVRFHFRQVWSWNHSAAAPTAGQFRGWP